MTKSNCTPPTGVKITKKQFLYAQANDVCDGSQDEMYFGAASPLWCLFTFKDAAGNIVYQTTAAGRQGNMATVGIVISDGTGCARFKRNADYTVVAQSFCGVVSDQLTWSERCPPFNFTTT